MAFRVGRRFWVVATAMILVFTVFIVGRNLIHVVQIKRQINVLEREQERYRARIDQDSTLLENLRYDDYLEEYARENFHMQRRDERVYVLKE